MADDEGISDQDRTDAARKAVRAVAERAALARMAKLADSRPTVVPLASLDDDLDRRHGELDLELKRRYASGLLKLLIAQMVFANAIFLIYAWAGRDWDVPDAVMTAWLASTVVELIGVVAVVTRYLFPRRD